MRPFFFFAALGVTLIQTQLAVSDDSGASLGTSGIVLATDRTSNELPTCIDQLDNSMAYKACLVSVTEILTLRIKAALDRELEERADMDEAERTSGFGNADRVRTFDTGQTRWEEFVDAECRSAFAYVAPGSDASTAEIRCRNALYEERLRFLDTRY